MNALKVIGKVQPLENVVIMGPGPIGLLMVVLARFYGAGTIVVTGLEKDELRLALARDFGADKTIVADKEDVEEVVKDVTLSLKLRDLPRPSSPPSDLSATVAGLCSLARDILLLKSILLDRL